MSRMSGRVSAVSGAPHPGDPAQLQQVAVPVFHPRCGQLVSLSQGNKTASRSHATQVTNNQSP